MPNINWTEFSQQLQYLAEPQYCYMAAATLVLLFVLILLRRRQPKHIVAYSTKDGRVLVTRSAIVELVKTTCDQLQAVHKPLVKMNLKGKKTNFDISVKLKNSGQLRQVEKALQLHLREALTENFGIEQLGQINIIATGFKSGRIELSSPVHSLIERPANNKVAELVTEKTEVEIEPNPSENKGA
jgi:hypothetical protein